MTAWREAETCSCYYNMLREYNTLAITNTSCVWHYCTCVCDCVQHNVDDLLENCSKKFLAITVSSIERFIRWWKIWKNCTAHFDNKLLYCLSVEALCMSVSVDINSRCGSINERIFIKCMDEFAESVLVIIHCS